MATGFCYLDSTCFHRDGQSDYCKYYRCLVCSANVTKLLPKEVTLESHDTCISD